MGLSEKLTEAKSEIDSLITYANGVTGESDTSIGDAILTLSEGYGSGESSEISKFISFPFSPQMIKGFYFEDDCYVFETTIDVDKIDSSNGQYIINHGYGKIPNSMLLIRKDFISSSSGDGIGVYTYANNISLSSNMLSQSVINSMLRMSTNLSSIYGSRVKSALPIIEQTDSWGVKSISSTEIVLNGRSTSPFITRGEYYVVMK